MTRAAAPGGAGVLRHPKSLLIALGATVVATLPPFLTGGLGVEIHAALGLSARDLGVLVSVYFGASAVCSTPLGHLGQRLGARRALVLAALTSATSLLGVAVWARSFGALIACLAMGGVGNALTQPTVNGFLADGIHRRELGLALGIKQSAIPVAVLLSGVSIPALALTVGWRGVFGVAAALAVAFGVWLSRATASFVPVVPRADRVLPARRPLIALAGAAGLGSVGGNALGTFLVTSAVASGVAQGAAGLVLAGGSAVCILVRVVAGGFVDRSRVDPLVLVAGLMLCGTGGLLVLSAGVPALVVVGTPIAFGGGWGWAGLFQLAVVSRNPSAPAIATGITQTGVYAGAATGPLAFGLIANWSYSVAWAFTALAMLAAAALVVLARRGAPLHDRSEALAR